MDLLVQEDSILPSCSCIYAYSTCNQCFTGKASEEISLKENIGKHADFILPSVYTLQALLAFYVINDLGMAQTSKALVIIQLILV